MDPDRKKDSDQGPIAPDCRVGVLLVNLGTPDAPTRLAVHRYLIQLLSDPGVVDIPRVIWIPLLHGIIAPIRSGRVARDYQKIWQQTSESTGSPLLRHSEQLAARLQESLEKREQNKYRVRLAMRYGNPDIETGIRALRQDGFGRILVLPLYPQYSGATTKSAVDTVTKAIASTTAGHQPAPDIRSVSDYHDSTGYITALGNSVRKHREQISQQAEQFLLISFHGLPKRLVDAGDPYYQQCLESGRLLAEDLGLGEDQWQLTFQSRFGREEWLTPYSDEVLTQLAQNGVKNVDVICPGFPTDCLETLHEVQVTNRDLFLASGGRTYHYIPALNDAPEHANALAKIVTEHTADWVHQSDEEALAQRLS